MGMGMRGKRRALPLAGAVVAAGAVAVWAGAAGPAKASTVTSTPWRVANVWGSAEGALTSVAATGPGDAWAAGTLYHGSTPVAPIVAHWNGTAWQTATPTVLSGYIFPYQVKASSPSNVWIYASKQLATQVKLFHFDGAHWHAISLPAGIQGASDMVVLGPKDVWFTGMGSVTSTGKPQTDVWHWNGSTWTNHPVGAYISGLTGISDANLQAVGNTGLTNSSFTGTLTAYKWTGSRWIAMGIPSAGGHWFPAITMDAANDVWIASETRDGNSAFALHWNGRTWTRLNAPSDVAAAADPVPDGHGGVWLGSLAYWTGRTWVDTGILPPGAAPDNLRTSMVKVPGTANSYWSGGYSEVGNGPARPAMLYYGPKP